jgi:RNA recognition motif-containing protein
MSAVNKTTVYVSGLPPRTTPCQLEHLLTPYGTVRTADIIQSPTEDTVAYVDMSSSDEARRAVHALDGVRLNERARFCCLISSPLWVGD